MEREVFEVDPGSENHKPSFTDRWLRSDEGYLAGVCQGLSEALPVEPWVIRLAWVLSILVFGSGIIFYLILALSLPKKEDLVGAYEPRFLGVCLSLSYRFRFEVGLVRALSLLLAISSLGLFLVIYFLIYLFKDD